MIPYNIILLLTRPNFHQYTEINYLRIKKTFSLSLCDFYIFFWSVNSFSFLESNFGKKLLFFSCRLIENGN